MAHYFGVDQVVQGRDGTVAYMAPEMLSGSPYDEAVDMWALGVIMYILLSGYHPFDPTGELDDAGVAKAVLSGKWAFDDECWTHVSTDGKALIRELLVRVSHSQHALAHLSTARSELIPALALLWPVTCIAHYACSHALLSVSLVSAPAPRPCSGARLLACAWLRARAQQPDPVKRASASEVLASAWVRGRTERMKPLPQDTATKMKAFNEVTSAVRTTVCPPCKHALPPRPQALTFDFHYRPLRWCLRLACRPGVSGRRPFVPQLYSAWRQI